VVSHPVNLYYLCGFSGSSGALVVRGDSCELLTDGRYTVQAREEVTAARVRIGKQGLLASVADALRSRRRARIGFEASHLTVSQRLQLGRLCGPGVGLRPMNGSIEQLRAVKDPGEVEAMRAAAGLGSRVFERVLPVIRPGIRESELAAEIEYQMRKLGAAGPSFETIVAFGERSAMPHARPTDKQLRKNELVVLDLGAILRHYCCDLTRTVYVGRAPARVKRWYFAVLEAQRAAIGAVAAGATGESVDRAARQVLTRLGLGSRFAHSTGHGLGLEVHEQPRLARGSKDKLAAGNVVTVEPGVYIEGSGGIRIEDDVLVGRNGNEVLTTANREFLQL